MVDRQFAKIVTKLPGKKASEVVRRTSKFVSPSISRFYPLVIESAHGAIVNDVDGNHFLDFTSGIAVLNVGSTHPKVVEAAERQIRKFIHFSYTDFYYENLVKLAGQLVGLVPGEFEKMVYFGNSGTEAMEAAMKLARNYTRRPLFVAHTGAFHGRTMGALSLTASKPDHQETAQAVSQMFGGHENRERSEGIGDLELGNVVNEGGFQIGVEGAGDDAKHQNKRGMLRDEC